MLRMTEALSLVEARAVDHFFGYDVLDPEVPLGDLDAVVYSSTPLYDFCERVLFDRPSDRLLVSESSYDGGVIAVLPSGVRFGSPVQAALCIRVRWADYRGLRGVRRLAEQVYCALAEVDRERVNDTASGHASVTAGVGPRARPERLTALERTSGLASATN
jgi:hypothetical protein